jgi:hypothetical protein
MKTVLATVLWLFVTLCSGTAQVGVLSPHRSITTASSVAPPSTIRGDVALPSPEFTSYSEGDLVRISVPSNWRELPAFNAVTFAPEGAYGNAGLKSVFTHGFAMGVAHNERRDLRVATDKFIDAYVLLYPIPGRSFSYRQITISDRQGLETTVSTVSEATSEPERIDVRTTLLRDGTLFYMLAVTPRACALDYADTFRRIVASIEIRDRGLDAARERHVPERTDTRQPIP